MDKEFLISHLDELKAVLCEDKCLIAENYNARISTKGNFVIADRKTGEELVFSVTERLDGSYNFKCVNENSSCKNNYPANKETQMLREHLQEVSDIVQKVFSYYWSFLPFVPIAKQISSNQKSCLITIFADQRTYIVSIDTSKYRDASLNQNECIKKFLEVCEAEFIKYAKSTIPPPFDQCLSNAISIEYLAAKNFGSKAEKLSSIIEKVSNEDKLLVIGKKSTETLMALYNKIFQDKIKIKYDPDKKVFVAFNNSASVNILPGIYNTEAIKKNAKNVKKIKEELDNIMPDINYYSYIFEHLNKIKIPDCKIALSKKDFAGICTKDVAVPFSYAGRDFSIPFSLPHLPFSEEEDMKEIKKKVKTSLERIGKEIKEKVEEIKEEKGKKCRTNKTLYQSYAAQAIYDFLDDETYPCSISRIADYLVSGFMNGYPVNDRNRKYGEILNDYTKSEVKEIVSEMYNAGLLTSFTKKGTYGRFDVYAVNEYNWDYDLYFNNDTRNKKEIMQDLKNGVILSPCDSLLLIKEMEEGRVREKDLPYTLNLFKNHEFVLRNQEKLKNVFLNTPDNVKLYIPFIIDEYKKASLERKTLRDIEKSLKKK